jgi:hypothetical protein
MEKHLVAARAPLRRLFLTYPDWPYREYADQIGLPRDWMKRLREAPPDDKAVLWNRSSVRHHLPPPFDPRVINHILPFFPPTKSPWLNPIEPKWVPGIRAVVEPKEALSAKQLAERVCAYFKCASEPHLSIPERPLDSTCLHSSSSCSFFPLA